MWTSSFHGEPPDPDWFRRMSAPENEIPVAVPLNTVLARTDDIGVALIGVQVYTTGVAFDLVVRVRPAAADRLRVQETVWGHHGQSGRFLLGVELADGRRATNQQMPEPWSELIFHQGGGSAGSTGVDQSWWLSPVPPDGPLRFVVRCVELGIEETVVEIDGSALRRAADGVVVLWPWSPPDVEPPPPPPPPDVPGDSWFAG